jgi:flagellin-specific chaperone FliS
MNELTLNVYDDENKVVKTSKAELVELKFGAIRKLMKLLNIDNINDTAELLKTVYSAWDQLTKILNSCFPDMTEDDWDNVKVSELIPVLITILKYSFTQMLTIPADSSKN